MDIGIVGLWNMIDGEFECVVCRVDCVIMFVVVLNYIMWRLLLFFLY